MDENVLESVIDDAAQELRDENINISDVIEVIQTDPDFKKFSKAIMHNGGGEITGPSRAPSSRHQAVTRIIEEPATKALRFRYECEGRSAGSIPGVSSTPENKTFPTIKVEGYQGKAVVIVSCVTKDPPYKPHPHKLVGREGCKMGVCTLSIPPETMTVQFSNLGIQCVKKKDIEKELKTREDIRVDPFRTGFTHRNQPTSIDLNSVRLCFQVFLEGEHGKYSQPLQPVVSQVIHDKKAMNDISIIKLSHCVDYVDGGRTDIILLCEKVAKEDIKVRFYEKENGQIVWEAYADFQPSQVHKQHAIWFKTPRYKTLEVTKPVDAFIQLVRPSDDAKSEALPFKLLPLDSEPGMLKRKRQKYDDNHVLKHLEYENTQQYNLLLPQDIKSEPRDKTPSPMIYGGISSYTGGAMYVQNQAFSPQYQDHSMGPTPPPPNMAYPAQYQVPSPTCQQTIAASVASQQLQQNWNIPNELDGAAVGILDLDTNTTINSTELVERFDIEQFKLSDIENLSLGDINPTMQDQSMGDSMTRYAIDNICQLNNMPQQ